MSDVLAEWESWNGYGFQAGEEDGHVVLFVLTDGGPRRFLRSSDNKPMEFDGMERAEEFALRWAERMEDVRPHSVDRLKNDAHDADLDLAQARHDFHLAALRANSAQRRYEKAVYNIRKGMEVVGIDDGRTYRVVEWNVWHGAERPRIRGQLLRRDGEWGRTTKNLGVAWRRR